MLRRQGHFGRQDVSRTPRLRHANSEGAAIAATDAEISAFWNWFGGAVTIDPQGRPMVVYRGEYGPPDSVRVLSTRLGSLSFGDRETAHRYAHYPNRSEDLSAYPRIHAVYVAIRRPVVNQPDDPFIDLTTIEAALGRQSAERIAKKFSAWLKQTSPWRSCEISAASVEEFLEGDPDGLACLYVQAFPLFDDPEEVADMKAAGFDGAIYGGMGFNAGEIEFRVFDAASVREVAPGAVCRCA